MEPNRADAYEALSALLAEMQEELALRQWDGDKHDRAERAAALRNNLFEAVCTYATARENFYR